MDSTWVSMGFAAIGAGGVVFTVLRNRGQDNDHRIDERIELSVGKELTEIKAGIRELRGLIPSRDVQIQDSARITELERRLGDQSKNLSECFKRIRDIETTCAASGHKGAGAA